MATIFLSTAKNFFPSLSSPTSSSSSSSLTSSSTTVTYPTTQNLKNPSTLTVTLCKAASESPSPSPVLLTKRSLAFSLTTTFTLFLAGKGLFDANAAILEADDDLELLEKVKKDRQKRLERQGVISSSNSETAYLQELVYKLSKVGQAIDNNDLSAAGSVLGPNTESDWVQKVNQAFNKLSSNAEEKTEVDAFNSSLATLISSVTQKDIKSSKIAFASSALALEKWTALTGLVGQLKGL